MKYLLKAFVWLVILTFGFLLGVKLLPGFVWWKILLFFAVCYAVGQIAYKLFRLIDKRFSSKSRIDR